MNSDPTPTELNELSQVFRDFAQWEAHGVSALCERLARAVADDAELFAYFTVAPTQQRKATRFCAGRAWTSAAQAAVQLRSAGEVSLVAR